MNEDNMKEVYFSLYCSQCKDENTPEEESPCDECLKVGGRPNTHKPLFFKEKEK